MEIQTQLDTFTSDTSSLVDDLIEEINRFDFGQSALFESERPPPPKQYCVYVLICEKVDAEDARQNALSNLGYVPSWIDAPANYSNLYYVGKTSDPYRRLEEHNRQDMNAAKFVRIYPAKRVESLEWFDDFSEAKDAELSIAEEYRDERSFVPFVDFE